jgi:hypothetical protein
MGVFMWSSIPQLAFIVAARNILVFALTGHLENTVFGVRLLSGAQWAFSNGDTLTIFMARKSINYNDN